MCKALFCILFASKFREHPQKSRLTDRLTDKDAFFGEARNGPPGKDRGDKQ